MFFVKIRESVESEGVDSVDPVNLRNLIDDYESKL